MFEVVVSRKGSPVEASHTYTDAHTAYAARLAIVSALYKAGWRGKRNAAGVWRMWRGAFRSDRIAIRIVELAEFSLN